MLTLCILYCLGTTSCFRLSADTLLQLCRQVEIGAIDAIFCICVFLLREDTTLRLLRSWIDMAAMWPAWLRTCV